MSHAFVLSTGANPRGAMAPATFDVAAVRATVPALHQQVNGRSLVYLDNGATSLKPQAMLDALLGYYGGYCANVHRGVHALSVQATLACEAARLTVAEHLQVTGPDAEAEIVFVRGTTEAINLVASTYGERVLQAGDEIVVSALEHHSNLVPWQMLAARRGVVLRFIPFDATGVLDLAAYGALLGPKTRLVAIAEVSNALGTRHPVAEMAAMAHAVGAVVLVDGAQAVPHGRVDVRALGADFYAFSGHKCFGPTGIGVLWGRRALLVAAGPWHGGGDMIRSAALEGSTWAELPARLEAGTPHIAGIIGLGAALSWLQSFDAAEVARHEARLLAALTAAVEAVPGARVIGTAPHKAAVVSFVLEGTHPADVGTLLDQQGVAVRTGHHCAEPAMRALGLSGTVRASLALYNDDDDVARFADALLRAARLLR